MSSPPGSIDAPTVREPDAPADQALDRNDSPILDEELARRARTGSEACFESLVRRYQVPLMTFLVSRLPTRADAEDVLQETFVKASRYLHQYDDAWLFRTWIFTIARREAISHHRRRDRPTEDERALANLPAAAEHPSHRLERDEQRQSLWAIARRVLTEDQYTALWLFYVEGMPAGQIAQVMNRSWVGIKTTLHRARKRLTPHLAAPAGGAGRSESSKEAGES